MTGRHTDQPGPPSPNRPSTATEAEPPAPGISTGQAVPARYSTVSVRGGREDRTPKSLRFGCFQDSSRRHPSGWPSRVRRPALVSASLLRRDSNPRPPHYECGALPAELRSVRHGDAPCCSALNSMVFESHRVCRACHLPSPWRSDEGIEPRTARTSLRRRDSNPRPPGYEPGGLPTCPTPRWLIRAATLVSGRSHRHPPR